MVVFTKAFMKTVSRFTYIAATLLCSATIVHGASAAESSQCTDLVKECFAYSGAARDNCFVTVSKHPFCRDSEASHLSARRAELSAILPNDAESGPSLLGPQLVDRSCVSNFDNAWLSALVKGAPSPETYANLRQSLEACARTSASDMMRP